MNPTNFLSFTEKEEHITDILVGLGLRRNVARVLVYLSSTDEATSRMIERGTDLRQPEVSMAMRQLREFQWIESTESKGDNKGRPVKIYRLSRPFKEIMDFIEGEKKKDARIQLELVQKLREAVSV
ncbi:MAG: ArsR family transcriptional regulator [Methanomicrobiales archaeon]|nr:ArsR family transcriptional regulator [Methanomicrobiales archaeon]